MQTETLSIEITLETEFNNTAPKIFVSVDENVIFSGAINDPTLTIVTSEQLALDKKHSITIVRQGKSNDCPEQMCKITGLKIDGTNIRDIMQHTCVYYPDYPEPWASEQKEQGLELEYPVYGETWFGHNGIWQFEFTSPFYQFLISKVKGQ